MRFLSHRGALWELPPRARRIHCNHNVILTFPGTTSACAENTTLGFGDLGKCRNYLRVRGEYVAWTVGKVAFSELPPRARRIQGGESAHRAGTGTTSACAENTPSSNRGF